MPPKKSSQRKSQHRNRLSEEIIPIYQILSNKQIQKPLIDLIPQIQRTLQQKPIALKISFLHMLVRLCGLQEYSSDIQSQNTVEGLQDILEKAFEIKRTLSTPLIIDSKNKFRKQFISRLRQTLQSIMSDQLKLMNDINVQFNPSFLVWLQVLTTSKLRIVRSSSIQFSKIFVEEELKLYEQYYQKKQSKKALNIAKNIGYYLDKIFSQRLNDIDQSIRDMSFQATEFILGQLEGEIVTQDLLNRIFSPLFGQDQAMLDKGLQIFYNLLLKSKNSQPFIDYVKDQLHRLVQLSKSTSLPGTNVLALRIIQFVHHKNPTLKLLNKDYMISVLENFASSTLYYGLHASVAIFYQSLYSSSEQLEFNSTIVLIQIINLLLGVSNQRNIPIILKGFFVSNKNVQSTKIFDIDNMFTLMMCEYYRDEKSTDVKLQQRELSLLLTVLNQWIQHCALQFKHLIRDKPIYEKILQTFNNRILINCKQLFFQKMPKYHQFSQKYLSLFVQIHPPTLNSAQLQDYLTFVTSKIEKLFIEKLQNCNNYGQIVEILENLSKDQDLRLKYSPKNLIDKLNIFNLVEQNFELSEPQIYKISSVIRRVCIFELTTSENFMFNIIRCFADDKNRKNEKMRMQILMITHMIHHYNLMELFSNTSQRHQNIYKNFRNKIIEFYIQIINNDQEPSSIRLSAFRALTFLLKAVSNRRFEESPTAKNNAYELSPEEMKIIYRYVMSQLFNIEDSEQSSLDITKMLNIMSLQSHQTKREIIQLLFKLYQESYVFTCHPQSARFLSSLIKGQHELQKQPINISSQINYDLSKQIQKLLNNLLHKYIDQQMKAKNSNKLFYWRLCYEIFNQDRQDQKFEAILDKFLSTYYSKKKLFPEQKKCLSNKILLFILHAVDKILQRKQYICLDIYENILKRIYRKIEKEILIRIKEFFIEKTEGIDSPYVKSFLQTLQNISKVQIKKVKQEEKDDNNSGSEQNQVNNEEDQGQEQKQTKPVNKRNRGRPATKKKEPSRIMEVEQNQPAEEISSRRGAKSETKKKLR